LTVTSVCICCGMIDVAGLCKSWLAKLASAPASYVCATWQANMCMSWCCWLGVAQVLCTTGTLAMGVNLPAHLVVLKGTVRWVGDTDVLPGEQPGYNEYSQTEVRHTCRAPTPLYYTS
jgi:hypothetical protein